MIGRPEADMPPIRAASSARGRACVPALALICSIWPGTVPVLLAQVPNAFLAQERPGSSHVVPPKGAPGMGRLAPGKAPQGAVVEEASDPLRPEVDALRTEITELRRQVKLLGAGYVGSSQDRQRTMDRLARRVAQAERKLGAAELALERTLEPPTDLLVGLNTDSLAVEMARQVTELMRRLGPAAARGMQDMANRLVHDIPPVGWKDARGRSTPLPSAATRDINWRRALPATVRRLSLMHRYGDVQVEPSLDGSLGLQGKVTVEGMVPEAEARELADSVRVDVGMDSVCALVVRIPSLAGRRDQAIRVDLTLQIPAGMALTFNNSYGDVSLERLTGRVEGRVTYGDIVARDLQAETSLDVRNGDIRMESCSAPTRASGQFGAIILTHMTSPVAVSGVNSEISLDDLRGDARVDVRGGSLQLRGSIGAMEVTASNCDVGMESLRGSVNLTSSMARTDLSQIAGSVTVQATHGTLNTSFVERDQELQTRFCEVHVDNPGANVRVSAESAPLVFRMPEATAGRRYELNNRFGNITLDVSPRSSVVISVASNAGSIFSELPLRRSDAGDWQRGEVTLGRGEGQMVLQGVGAAIRIGTSGH